MPAEQEAESEAIPFASPHSNPSTDHRASHHASQCTEHFVSQELNGLVHDPTVLTPGEETVWGLTAVVDMTTKRTSNANSLLHVRLLNFRVSIRTQATLTFIVVLVRPSNNTPRNYIKLGHDTFLPHLLDSINHPAEISRYGHDNRETVLRFRVAVKSSPLL